MLILTRIVIVWLIVLMTGGFVGKTAAEDLVLFRHSPSNDPRRATIRIDLETRSPYRVNPLLFGKFTEHLGHNIYNGIDAQILMNPTFGKWAFSSGDNPIDGGAIMESDPRKITNRIERYAHWLSLPNPSLLVESYKEGAAFGWMRTGSREEVVLSPDVGESSDRAQRVEVLRTSEPAPQGITK